METQEHATRIDSLDALRALTVAAMIFVDHPTIPAAVPPSLLHAKWDGLTFADVVFPAFVFIVGASMAFSAAKRVDAGSRRFEGLSFIRRIVLLFAMGLGISYLKYGLPLRIMGVLQRIALGSLLAWPLRRSPVPVMLAVAAALLASHSYILLEVAAPGVAAGSLVREANIAGWVDTTVLGVEHTHRASGFDPEGLLGVLSTAAQVLLGMAAGTVLQRWGRRPVALLGLGASAAVLIAAGFAAAPYLPINKALWTATFVLVTSGYSLLALTVLYALSDMIGHTWWLKPLVPLGRNALLIYAASNALVTYLRSVEVATIAGETVSLFTALGMAAADRVGETAATLSVAGAEIALWLVVAAVLHHFRLYLKL